jgi:succinate dehydrogenase / fumarate reductase, iron-sulfur subunit
MGAGMHEPGVVHIRVLRGDPAAGEAASWQEYEIDLPPGESVTGALRRIVEQRDGSLAYRVSCHRGICASCIMRINGKQRLGCVTEVTGDLELQPALGTVLKDLVVEQ